MIDGVFCSTPPRTKNNYAAAVDAHDVIDVWGLSVVCVCACVECDRSLRVLCGICTYLLFTRYDYLCVLLPCRHRPRVLS